VRPRAKATIDSLYIGLLVGSHIYEESIGTKMNDLDLCFEVVSRSCQPLRYTTLIISEYEIEAWFLPKDHQ